ncbi:MAG: hypothetical protein ACO3E8_04260 [Candidatus Methylacidiphilales bacterium]
MERDESVDPVAEMMRGELAQYREMQREEMEAMEAQGGVTKEALAYLRRINNAITFRMQYLGEES